MPLYHAELFNQVNNSPPLEFSLDAEAIEHFQSYWGIGNLASVQKLIPGSINTDTVWEHPITYFYVTSSELKAIKALSQKSKEKKENATTNLCNPT